MEATTTVTRGAGTLRLHAASRGTSDDSDTLIFKRLMPRSFIKTFYRRTDDPSAAEKVSRFTLVGSWYITYDSRNLVTYMDRRLPPR